MRKIKNYTLLCLALLPFAVYLITIFATKQEISFLSCLQNSLGNFGGSPIEDILTNLFTNLLPFPQNDLSVNTIIYLFSYYITLIVVNIFFSLLTFLLTMFDKTIDKFRGVRK